MLHPHGVEFLQGGRDVRQVQQAQARPYEIVRGRHRVVRRKIAAVVGGFISHDGVCIS